MSSSTAIPNATPSTSTSTSSSSTTPTTNGKRRRIIFVAVGGATCSGKTTLAKHLFRILPNSPLLLHQDDFAPPSELVPIHVVYGVQDWDDAKGALLWDKQRETIKYLRENGSFPNEHYSHDHLNEQIQIPISDKFQNEWRTKFLDLQRTIPARSDNLNEEDEVVVEEEVQPPLFIIADGFLMLYDEESVREFDIRLFVREDYSVLKKRREERHGYHTAEGALWRDPPNYFDQIVWPAYLAAHRGLFKDGNVKSGEVDENHIDGLVILEGSVTTMEETVNQACETIYETIKAGKTAKDWKKP